jgi:hypothetical protein
VSSDPLRWNITEETYHSSLMPVIDDKLVGLMFVGPEQDARFLMLHEGENDRSLRAVSLGGKSFRLAACACNAGALSVFALDTSDVLWYARYHLPHVEGKHAAWNPIGNGVNGFSVARIEGKAHVFAIASDRRLRLMTLTFDKDVADERHWLDFGTLDEPGLRARSETA